MRCTLHKLLFNGTSLKSSQAVSILFDSALGREVSNTLSESWVGCVSGCGACAQFQKVSAFTTLNILPLAFDFYNKGLSDTILSFLDS